MYFTILTTPDMDISFIYATGRVYNSLLRYWELIIIMKSYNWWHSDLSNLLVTL